MELLLGSASSVAPFVGANWFWHWSCVKTSHLTVEMFTCAHNVTFRCGCRCNNLLLSLIRSETGFERGAAKYWILHCQVTQIKLKHVCVLSKAFSGDTNPKNWKCKGSNMENCTDISCELVWLWMYSSSVLVCVFLWQFSLWLTSAHQKLQFFLLLSPFPSRLCMFYEADSYSPWISTNSSLRLKHFSTCVVTSSPQFMQPRAHSYQLVSFH